MALVILPLTAVKHNYFFKQTTLLTEYPQKIVEGRENRASRVPPHQAG
jgi:hypothetical protein